MKNLLLAGLLAMTLGGCAARQGHQAEPSELFKKAMEHSEYVGYVPGRYVYKSNIDVEGIATTIYLYEYPLLFPQKVGMKIEGIPESFLNFPSFVIYDNGKGKLMGKNNFYLAKNIYDAIICDLDIMNKKEVRANKWTNKEYKEFQKKIIEYYKSKEDTLLLENMEDEYYDEEDEDDGISG